MTAPSSERVIPIILLSAVAFSGLDAYLVFGIPFVFFSYLLVLVAIVLSGSLTWRHEVLPYLGLFGWLLVVTAFRIYQLEESVFLNLDLGFMAVRFVRLFGFTLTVLIFLNYLMRGQCDWLKFFLYLIYIGAFVAAVGLYIYLAQLYGLPEPIRNRPGTAHGQGQSVVFTYPFHRLMGTFREPGLYVEWLLLPFFLSLQLVRRSYGVVICSGIMLGSLLLTGSLSVWIIISIVLTVSMVKWFADPDKTVNAKLIVAISIGLVLFLSLVKGQHDTHGYRLKDTSELSSFQLVMLTIEDRLLPVLEDGMESSNRLYIYEYTKQTKVGYLGFGFGIANLKLAAFFGIDLPISFLSLYRNVLYSSGIIGISLLYVALLLPIMRNENGVVRIVGLSRDGFWILCLYFSYLLTFYSTVEELTFGFAISTALLPFFSRMRDCSSATYRH